MATKYMLGGNGMKPVGDADDIPEDTPLVIMICLAIVVVELIYFKHRKWL